MGRMTPQRVLIMSFACAIALGSILLSLPAATENPGGLPFIDSLFTATSATCVTGLVVRDTAPTFSPFGEAVILLLIQAGGLGIMTFSVLFAVLLGRKIGLTQSFIIQSTLDGKGVIGFRRLALYILGIVLASEAFGAILLFLRWSGTLGLTFWETVWTSWFHSVSAFCNAGFSLFSDSLMSFRADPAVNLIMMGLIILGGLGFIVIVDLLGLFYKKGPARALSLQSKLALIVSGALIIIGAAAIFFLEKDHLMKAMTWPERIWGSFFTSIAARTAGFNTLPTGQFSVSTLIFIVFLMFIGASPGSTGGGIKTVTFAVLGLSVYSMYMKRKRVQCFNRSIPLKVIREAFVIFFIALFWIFGAMLLLTHLEGRFGTLSRVMFEVVSAFGTVGFSAGITGSLSSASKAVLILTMFVGRVGPLTLALAVAHRERREDYLLPSENMMVG